MAAITSFPAFCPSCQSPRGCIGGCRSIPGWKRKSEDENLCACQRRIVSASGKRRVHRSPPAERQVEVDLRSRDHDGGAAAVFPAALCAMGHIYRLRAAVVCLARPGSDSLCAAAVQAQPTERFRGRHVDCGHLCGISGWTAAVRKLGNDNDGLPAMVRLGFLLAPLPGSGHRCRPCYPLLPFTPVLYPSVEVREGVLQLE